MIQVTLTFTSIEAAIAVLRGIPENSVQIATPAAAPEITPEGNAVKVKAEKPAKTKPEASQSVAPAAAPSAVEQPAPAPEVKAEPVKEAAPAAEVLDYAVLQKAVFALAAKSKEAALAVNASFGVKTMKDLPEGKRREALAAVNAKLAGLEVA